MLKRGEICLVSGKRNMHYCLGAENFSMEKKV